MAVVRLIAENVVHRKRPVAQMRRMISITEVGRTLLTFQYEKSHSDPELENIVGYRKGAKCKK